MTKMDTANILVELKELTLALATGKRTRQATVDELYKRIETESIYVMKPDEPQVDFITEVCVSLEHLTEEGLATSSDEIQYLAECFEEKRTFSREDVRKFPIGDFENDLLVKQPKNKK
jgi:hypothetical protein